MLSRFTLLVVLWDFTHNYYSPHSLRQHRKTTGNNKFKKCLVGVRCCGDKCVELQIQSPGPCHRVVSVDKKRNSALSLSTQGYK